MVLLGILFQLGVVLSTFTVGLERIPVSFLYLSIAFEILEDLFLKFPLN